MNTLDTECAAVLASSIVIMLLPIAINWSPLLTNCSIGQLDIWNAGAPSSN